MYSVNHNNRAIIIDSYFRRSNILEKDVTALRIALNEYNSSDKNTNSIDKFIEQITAIKNNNPEISRLFDEGRGAGYYFAAIYNGGNAYVANRMSQIAERILLATVVSKNSSFFGNYDSSKSNYDLKRHAEDKVKTLIDGVKYYGKAYTTNDLKSISDYVELVSPEDYKGLIKPFFKHVTETENRNALNKYLQKLLESEKFTDRVISKSNLEAIIRHKSSFLADDYQVLVGYFLKLADTISATDIDRFTVIGKLIKDLNSDHLNYHLENGIINLICKYDMNKVYTKDELNKILNYEKFFSGRDYQRLIESILNHILNQNYIKADNFNFAVQIIKKLDKEMQPKFTEEVIEKYLYHMGYERSFIRKELEIFKKLNSDLFNKEFMINLIDICIKFNFYRTATNFLLELEGHLELPVFQKLGLRLIECYKPSILKPNAEQLYLSEAIYALTQLYSKYHQADMQQRAINLIETAIDGYTGHNSSGGCPTHAVLALVCLGDKIDCDNFQMFKQKLLNGIIQNSQINNSIGISIVLVRLEDLSDRLNNLGFGQITETPIYQGLITDLISTYINPNLSFTDDGEKLLVLLKKNKLWLSGNKVYLQAVSKLFIDADYNTLSNLLENHHEVIPNDILINRYNSSNSIQIVRLIRFYINNDGQYRNICLTQRADIQEANRQNRLSRLQQRATIDNDYYAQLSTRDYEGTFAKNDGCSSTESLKQEITAHVIPATKITELNNKIANAPKEALEYDGIRIDFSNIRDVISQEEFNQDDNKEWYALYSGTSSGGVQIYNLIPKESLLGILDTRNPRNPWTNDLTITNEHLIKSDNLLNWLNNALSLSIVPD